MKNNKFIFGMHGLVFSVYLIVNSVIKQDVYEWLDSIFKASWASQVADLFISAFLYVSIYNIVYLLRKLMVLHVKKEVISLNGEWYHLHIKLDENGNPRENGLRPGKTKIKQDIYDLRFSGKNHACTLNDDGTITWRENERKDTTWNSWSVDWDGKGRLVTCFKANTQVKTNEEFTDRYGIHKLEITNGGKRIKGVFADEYPSKNKGEIYFFRTEKELYDFMRSLEDNDQ